MSTSEAQFEAAQGNEYGTWFPPPYRVPANGISAALSKSIVAASGAVRLFGFVATSTNVAAQFIQVFDLGAVPSNGAIPRFTLNVAAASFVAVSYGEVGCTFDRGIVICNSTTQGTLTLGAADTLFDVQYVF